MKNKYYIAISALLMQVISYNTIKPEEGLLEAIPKLSTEIDNPHTLSKQEQLKAIENDPLLGNPTSPRFSKSPTELHSQHLIEEDLLDSPTSVKIPDRATSLQYDDHMLAKRTDTAKANLETTAIKAESSLTEALNQDPNNTSIHLQKIEMALHNLPEVNRPKDMQQALTFISEGQKAWQSLQDGKVYEAVLKNMVPSTIKSQHIAKDLQMLKNAFNTTDEKFWDIIQADPTIKAYMEKKAKQNNIPFNRQSFSLKENNMYFRAKYARKMTSDPTVLKQYQLAYEKTIVAVQWHLYARTIIQESRPVPGSDQKASAFTSGMITVHDPEHRLFQFLDGYSELVSPHYKGHSAVSAYSITQTKAYPRKSSHYGGQKESFGAGSQDFGIDIQGDSNNPLKILPGNKSQLLYGVRDNGMTFVKWEDYGVTFNPVKGDYSVVPHTMGYFEKHGKEDNPAYHMREVVAKPVSQEFEKLYGKPLPKETQQYIDTYGISGMLKILAKEAPHKAESFKDFLIKTKGYQRATLHLRKGGEVVLSK